MTTAAAWAVPPQQRVPIPLFTFDSDSPSTMNAPPGFDPVPADSVLAKGAPSDPLPIVVIPGVNLGLGLPGDELDGISFNRTHALRNTEFVLLFSVGRATTGQVPPDPGLVAANAPFNVADQVIRGHAPGDGFASLVAFDSNGAVGGMRGISSNVQVINNYDEGGQDYQALPTTSSKDYVPIPTPKDNVNGTTYPPTSPSLRAGPGDPNGINYGIYFTVTPQSTSLMSGQLPGNSGADIFHDPAPNTPGLQQALPYANAGQLGLFNQDDINGLVVDDSNSNGFFDGTDCVYFSLTADSPSAHLLPFVSSNGAADVLVSCSRGSGAVSLEVFVSAADLGLAGQGDDVDALEIIPCGDSENPCDVAAFAAASGIRLFKGDWTNDGVINHADVEVIPACLSGPHEGSGFIPPHPLCRDIFDFESDSDVDLVDFGSFSRAFGTSPGDE